MKPSKKVQTTMTDRRKWLKGWIKLRNFEIDTPNDFLFYYHCTNKVLYGEELTWKLLQDMNEQLVNPLPMKQLQTIAEWKLNRIKNETIIKKLGITQDEVDELKIGHNKKKKEEQLARKAESVRTEAEIERLFAEGLTAAQIKERISEPSKRTIQRIIARYRDEHMTLHEKRQLAEEVLRLYQKNTVLNSIARRTGCSVETVRNILSLEGMTENARLEIKRSSRESEIFTTKEGQHLYDLSLSKSEVEESLISEHDTAMAALRTYTNNVFINGTAGTGKSFLIHRFLEGLPPEERKATLIVAPTGRAADHINGQTLHKAFHLPNEVQPNEEVTAAPKHLNAVNRIIIDEVNMVRQDVFSRVAKTIQFLEQQNKKKIQVIVLGDFGQIQPVATVADQELLKEFYPAAKGVYAFHSEQWEQMHFRKIVLKKIYRQDDPVFKEKLNELKYGCISVIDWFNLYSGVFKSWDAVTICPTNKLVEKYNQLALDYYDFAEMTAFTAIIKNGQPTEELPCPETLQLAVGMRVMTVCNGEKYKNGSMGQIVKINDKSIQVKFDSGNTVTISRRQFALQNGVIYEQIPVVMAYAITANKSEGMTFEEINVVPGFFAPGQLYTALSRCKSIDGIYLEELLTAKDLIVDTEALKMTIDEN